MQTTTTTITNRLTSILKESIGKPTDSFKQINLNYDFSEPIYKKFRALSKYIFKSTYGDNSPSLEDYRNALTNFFKLKYLNHNFKIEPLYKDHHRLSRVLGSSNIKNFAFIGRIIFENSKEKDIVLLIDKDNKIPVSKVSSQYFFRAVKEDFYNNFIQFNDNLLIGDYLLSRIVFNETMPDNNNMRLKFLTPHYYSKKYSFILRPTISLDILKNFDQLLSIPLADIKVASDCTGLSYYDYENLKYEVEEGKLDKKVFYEQYQEMLAVSFEGAKFRLSRLIDLSQQNNFFINLEKNLDEVAISENNLILTINYLKNLTKGSSARAFELKKNIDDATQLAMSTTSLNNFFKEVELDNDVDLSYLPQIEEEMSIAMVNLPVTITPTFRIKKLGKHGGSDNLVSGIYFPHCDNIILDCGLAMRENYSTLSSFMHELGHHYDFTLLDATPWSTSNSDERWNELMSTYQNSLKENDEGLSDKRISYLSTPTEIFARSFELFLYDLGVTSSFLKTSDEYDHQIEYCAFTQSDRNKINVIFSDLFPNIKAFTSLS